MRWLKINGLPVDIDDKTAIGIDIQGMDLKEPGVRKIKNSNSFSIPATINNLAIFDAVGGVQSNYSGLYEIKTVQYGIDNDIYINGSKIKVDSISDRISLTVSEAYDFFDKLKNVKGRAFFNLIDKFMQRNKDIFDYPTAAVGYRTLQSLMQSYSTSTSGMHIGMAYGSLYDKEFENIPGTVIDDGPPYYKYLESEFGGIKLAYPRTTQNEAGEDIIDLTVPNSVCPHFFIYAHTLVQAIQSIYNIDLGLGSSIPGNAWDDENFKKILVFVPGLRLVTTDIDHTDRNYYWEQVPSNNDGTYSYFDPLTNLSIDSYSCYDVLMGLVKLMSATIDKTETGYVFRRLDKLEDVGKIVNWSGKLDYEDVEVMKPYIPSYAKKSYIKYDKIEEGTGELAGAKTVVCTNQNLAEEAELFKVKAYVPNFGNFKGEIAPVLSKANALTNPVFLIADGKHTLPTKITTYSGSIFQRTKFTALVTLDKLAVYSMQGEYKFFDKVNDAPKFYDVNLWLTNNDIRDVDNFTMIYIKELNGCFYLNKISGFNPDKSIAATSCELIRISDRTPVPPADLPYFVDGQGNVFTDGQGNYFY